jgi:hypothetical protein
MTNVTDFAFLPNGDAPSAIDTNHRDSSVEGVSLERPLPLRGEAVG